MKRLFCLLLSLCLLLLGCSAGEAEVEGYTFTDDLGHSVTVQNPSRVAILLGSYAEAWTLAGGSFCAAVDDAWEEYDLNIPEDAVNLGNTKSMSLELLLSVQPDFVIASTNTSQHLQWEPTLEAAEIPVAYFDVYDFEDYLRMMKIFTDITERPDCYETYGLAVEEEIQSIITESQARTNDPTVLVLRISAATIRVRSSQGSILGEILRDLRCTNIADSDETLLENLSIERILQEDPDHIFLAPLRGRSGRCPNPSGTAADGGTRLGPTDGGERRPGSCDGQVPFQHEAQPPLGRSLRSGRGDFSQWPVKKFLFSPFPLYSAYWRRF